jgi:hypothetical protein
MCAIVGSFDKDKFLELIELNSKRGSFSHSFTLIDKNFHIQYISKEFGEFRKELIDNYKDGMYIIGHIQAPTGGIIKDYNRIHPAQEKGTLLWHNGILKDLYIKDLQERFNTDITWDTHLLLMNKDMLEDVNGTFSCLELKEDEYLKIYRNSDSPMFIDDDLNISSTKFIGSKSTTHNQVYSIDFINKKIDIISKWTSIHMSPYFFG